VAAIHGRNGALYADTAATAVTSGVTQLVAQMADYSVDQARDRVETTSFGDTTKTYVAGLADASGTINGFYNDASSAAFILADGSTRYFYLYVDSSSTARMAPISGSGKGYWYGTGTFDISTTTGVGDAAKVTLNWTASSSVSKV
jgi:hypothetical protein